MVSVTSGTLGQQADSWLSTGHTKAVSPGAEHQGFSRAAEAGVLIYQGPAHIVTCHRSTVERTKRSHSNIQCWGYMGLEITQCKVIQLFKQEAKGDTGRG